jgi:hypothetical protein
MKMFATVVHATSADGETRFLVRTTSPDIETGLLVLRPRTGMLTAQNVLLEQLSASQEFPRLPSKFQ